MAWRRGLRHCGFPVPAIQRRRKATRHRNPAMALATYRAHHSRRGTAPGVSGERARAHSCRAAETYSEARRLGLNAEWGVFSAAGSGAPHLRRRSSFWPTPTSSAWATGERRGATVGESAVTAVKSAKPRTATVDGSCRLALRADVDALEPDVGRWRDGMAFKCTASAEAWNSASPDQWRRSESRRRLGVGYPPTRRRIGSISLPSDC